MSAIIDYLKARKTTPLVMPLYVTYKFSRKVADRLVSPILYKIDPQIIYSHEEFHGEKDREFKKQFTPAVADIIIEFFKPADVFDIGCGQGTFIQALHEKGVKVNGCDLSEMALTNTPHKDFLLFQADATKPLLLNRRFDLCMCFEIAEHIPTEFSKQLVKNVTGVSDNALFTAAPPWQGGTGHINEQPFEFWIDLFDAEGYDYCKEETEAIRQRFKEANTVFWLYDNSMIFRKRK